MVSEVIELKFQLETIGYTKTTIGKGSAEEKRQDPVAIQASSESSKRED